VTRYARISGGSKPSLPSWPAPSPTTEHLVAALLKRRCTFGAHQPVTVYRRGHCGIVRANCHLTLAMYNSASDAEKFMRRSLNAPDDRCASRASQLAQSVHQWVSSRRN
jgi:hypothetical protein